MTLSNSQYLPICKSQILHFEIPCRHCGSLSGPSWTWLVKRGLAVCSPQCHKGLLKGPQAILQKNSEPRQDWVRFQDQMPDVLGTGAQARQYFKAKFGFDSSKEGLKAMRTKSNSLVARP